MGSFILLREAATRAFFVARVMFQALLVGWTLRGRFSWVRLICLHLFQLVVILYTHLTMYLDTWVYGARLPDVGDGRNMLFITGLPRTGSTFLQRRFSPEALNAPNLSFTLWELMFPSLSGRAIAKFLRADRWIGTFYKHLSTGTTVANNNSETAEDDASCIDFNKKHKFSLDTADEEEFLFFHIFNSPYLAGFLAPTCFEKHIDLDMFYVDSQPEFRRTKLQEWFINCLQRQMYSRGTTLLPPNNNGIKTPCNMVMKFPGAITKVHTLTEILPNARWVYLVRDPLEVIPSALSLAYSYFMFVYGKENKDVLLPRVRHYARQTYERLLRWAKYWHEEVEPSQSVDTLVIRFEDMMEDLEGTVDRICKFGGMSLDNVTMAELRKQSASHREKGHSKNTNHNLEFFGLNEESIKSDWAWYMDHYGLKHKTPSA